MRRGNGDGSVFKLSGKRRKPWAVRVTIGFTDEGKQKYKYIGYYENKTLAKNALNKYLVDPQDVAAQEKITLKDIFEAMIEKSKLAENTIRQYTFRFRAVEPLHNKEMSKITLAELEELFNKQKPSIQHQLKNVLTGCYLYAMKHKYVQDNVAQYLEVEQAAPTRKKIPFTPEEIRTLWNNLGSKPNDDVVLILLYTGMRVSELLEMEKQNVNLDEKYMYITKSKTKSGVRKVPIHDEILPIIRKRYEESDRYLIEYYGRRVTYNTYFVSYWRNKDHTIHETRHTFITYMTNLGIDDLTIKRIVGHANKDVTENYMHRSDEELLKAVNQLKYI